MENNTQNDANTTHIKSDARYLKLEILQIAAELETQASQAQGVFPKVADILATADKLADFVFAEEENLT